MPKPTMTRSRRGPTSGHPQPPIRPQRGPDEPNPTPADKAQAEPVSVAPDDYKIGPDDMLHISVWKEPDLTEPALPVRPDGKISLPLLNDVVAAGLTPSQLADSISTKLKKYLADPR